MLIEIVSSVVVGGIVGATYLMQNGESSDNSKIEKICLNAGLSAKDDRMQLYRKTKIEGGTEYAYRIPLGLSFQDFLNKQQKIEDGLNTKRTLISVLLSELRTLNFRENIYTQLKRIITTDVSRKEVTLDYDGMLRLRVYTNGLTELVPYTDELRSECKRWEIPVGYSREGLVKHNTDHIPHLVVAGTTRYGKTVFLKNVITTLTLNNPKNVRFTLIDLKGGLAFQRFKDLPQVRSVAKNVAEAKETLERLQSEMNDRMESFLTQGYEDVNESNIKERHFIIVDEAAQLASASIKEKGEKEARLACENVISEIARIGGGLGYRIIFATQYPTADTLPRQVKQNCDARICFRLQTSTASKVVLDEDGAEDLPHIKGRAIYLTDKKQTIQTPFITNEYIDDKLAPLIRIRPKNNEEAHHEANATENETTGSHPIIIG